MTNSISLFLWQSNCRIIREYSLTKRDISAETESMNILPKMTPNLVISFLCCFLAAFSVIGQEYRTFDGTANNLENPEWGAAGEQLLRISEVDYADGINAPSGEDRPNPRTVSNVLFKQENNIINGKGLSDYVWVFGQFIDHDISLTSNNPIEPAFVIVPENDEIFTPGSSIFMFRSMPAPNSGISIENPRQHLNEITSYLDLSNVYGSDKVRSDWLRSFEDGKLKVSQGNLLPWNTTTGDFNDPTDINAPFMADDVQSASKLFVAGDVRANENPLLIAFHTLFVREHNRICDEILQEYPSLDDEEVFLRARKWNIAAYQNIIFEEWLPAMGVSLPAYSSYKNEMNPSISNSFSGATFRLGHTLINSNIIRMGNSGEELASGHILLRDAYFNPLTINLAGGIEPYLKGMATQAQQELDCKVINDVRNFLFGSPNAGGLDLAAININRGRERGITDFNSLRIDLGLPAYHDFSEIADDEDAIIAMEDLYGDVNNIDAWVGLLAEKHMQGAMFGEVIMAVMERQFQALRDGDRFYFENDDFFSISQLEDIRSVQFHDIIMRNTEIDLMQKDVFNAMPHSDIPNGPELSKEALNAAAFPNPTDGELFVKIYIEESSDISLSLFNTLGDRVQFFKMNLPQGESILEFDLMQDLPRGFYNLLIETENSFKIVKIVKER
jgi:hypothetical protein